MKLHDVKECLDVHNSDISGSTYDDVNMSGTTIGNVNLAGCSFKQVNMAGAAIEDANLSGWKVRDVNFSGLKLMQANLQGASIKDSRLEGMTIDGILVTDLLTAPRLRKRHRPELRAWLFAGPVAILRASDHLILTGGPVRFGSDIGRWL